MQAPEVEAKSPPMPAAAIDDDRICTICVALLGQSSRMEDLIEEGALGTDSELDLDGFSRLVDLVEVQCTAEDKATIFRMIDADSSGTIDARELKEAVRSSGAISSMYDASVSTFAKLIGATLLFDLGIYLTQGSTAAFDFLTAYVVEDSLSVDNLFVFLLLFRYFKVPPQLVDTCLNYGITGSIALRGIFIFAGLAAVQAFKPLYLGFSAFLLFSSYQLLAGGEEEDEDDAPPELVTNFLDKLPLTGTFEGEAFVSNDSAGSPRLTQLTATLVCIALCDVLFAVDSIPAVLAVNSDPFIVYTSNIAAVVGLRSLYQLLSVAVNDLVYLEKAVAIVLGFVGLKLGASVAGFEVSSAISLAFIITTLTGGVVLSQFASDEDKNAFQPAPNSNFLDSFSSLGSLLSGEKKDDKP